MKIVCIAALAGTLLSTPLAAQTVTCPEAPPVAEVERSVGAGAGFILLNELLNKTFLKFKSKNIVKDNLPDYPNADALYIHMHYLSFKCKTIMADPKKSESEKLLELGEFADEWLDKIKRIDTSAVGGPPTTVRVVGQDGTFAEETGNLCQGAQELLFDILGVEIRASIFEKIAQFGIKEGAQVKIINDMEQNRQIVRPLFMLIKKEALPVRTVRCVIAMGKDNRADLGLPPYLGDPESSNRKGHVISIVLPTR